MIQIVILAILVGIGHTYQCSNDITVAGFSSGGLMATQLQVAYSSQIRGSAVFAGGCYYCAQGDINAAFSDCVYLTNDFSVETLHNKAEEFSKQGLIDDLRNLKDQPTFVWTGTIDKRVTQKASKKWAEFMKGYNADIKEVWDVECEHAFPDDKRGALKNESISPFVSNCGYRGAYEELNHLFHGNIINSDEGFKYSNIFRFDQNVYNPKPDCMSSKGFLYIPTGCQFNSWRKCPLHIVFHGCIQTYEHVGLGFMTESHYLDLAEKNNIIMMFPQSAKSLRESFNPWACWDFWGYCDGDTTNYATKNGIQGQAIMKAVEDLKQGRLELRVASDEIFDMIKCRNKPFYDTSADAGTSPSFY